MRIVHTNNNITRILTHVARINESRDMNKKIFPRSIKIFAFKLDAFGFPFKRGADAGVPTTQPKRRGPRGKGAAFAAKKKK